MLEADAQAGARVKALMTDLDNQLLVAATRRPGPRRERAEREPDVAQHSSKLDAAIARPTSLERQLEMDTTRSDERKTVATGKN